MNLIGEVSVGIPAFAALNMPRCRVWGSLTTSAMLRIGAAGTPLLLSSRFQYDAFRLLRRLERIGISCFLLRTRRGLVLNIFILASFSRSRTWQSACHCVSLPTATISSLSLQLNAWYGTMLG